MARPFEGKELTCLNCGTTFRRSRSEIDRGRTKYCTLTCSGSAHSGENNHMYKHGHASRGKYSPEWMTWRAMMDRCYVKSSSTYEKYGARGVAVCDRWHDFSNFYDDIGKKPSSKHSIDRIDGSKGYSLENCRWATDEEQANNQRSNRKVTWEGKTYNVSQLMRHLGIYTSTGKYYSRLDRGWSVERTFSS